MTEHILLGKGGWHGQGQSSEETDDVGTDGEDTRIGCGQGGDG